MVKLSQQNDVLLCPVADQCGACQHINEPYTQQLERKNAYVAELFGTDVVRPIIGMDNPYHYRNRVISPFAPGRLTSTSSSSNKRSRRNKHADTASPQREILCGMYAAGSHRIVATDGCLVENERAKAVILAVRSLMTRFRMEPYDEVARTGFLRHVAVRVGHTSGEVLVTLVTNSKDFPASKAFCRELVRRCPFITTIVQNVNEENTNVILGRNEYRLYGPGFILDRLCGLSFRISPQSFYQVNSVQTETLYRTALTFAALSGGEVVLDAYCGTGTIGLVTAKHGAAQVLGVDTEASAIHDARENARHNGVENASFEVADAGQYLLNRSSSDATIDVLMMDPPRSGASESFLEAAARCAPARIVYISCNPETQLADITQLKRSGYVLQAVQPVDVFPHTNHVETVALLSK